MNVRPHDFIIEGEALDPRMAAAVASVLRMVAEQLLTTADRPERAQVVRRRIGSTIGHLIELADALTGDADAEPDNDDEPSLGWGDRGPSALSIPAFVSFDCEIDAGDEPEAGDGDAELTAYESAGAGFLRTPGTDDDEDGHDDERELQTIVGGQGA